MTTTWKTTLAATLLAAFLVPRVIAGGCLTDLNEDGETGFDDLLMVLSEWGPCLGCASDLDGDGQTGFDDLLEILSAWGPCSVESFVALELAGLDLSAFPQFAPMQTFNELDPVWVGVDPARFPELVNQPALLWVVESRTVAEWDADPTLVDARGVPEGTLFPGPGLAQNIVPVGDTLLLSGDAGLAFGHGYDIVLDFDLNGVLGPGDLIDGYGAEAGFYLVSDPTETGPLDTVHVTYSGGTFLGQRTYYPADISAMGELPLVVISHGNGHSYTWYDYLGHHLASWGYVVMSHQNETMPGIESASTTTLTNTDYFLQNLGAIEGGVLDGHVDGGRITWIGHSRGGEGVARAYDRIVDGTWTPDAYTATDIKLISSIAPTDFLGPSAANPHDATYHLLYGAADGDVSGAPDCDICQSFHLYERATGERSSTYLHGTDHNDFNCCGFNDYTGPADQEIGRSEAQTVTKGTYRVLLAHVIEGAPAAEEFLWRQNESLRAPSVAAATVIDREFRRATTAEGFIVEDFQTQPSTSVSSSGGAVNFDVRSYVENRLDDGNSTFSWSPSDPMNGMTRGRSNDTSRGAVFDYDTDAFLEFEVVPEGRDFSLQQFLSFRACQGTRHPNTSASSSDLNFTVSLRDGAGETSSIRINVYRGGLENPFRRSGSGTGLGWQNEFETIRIRLSNFTNDGVDLDLSDIVAVRFEFGPSFGHDRGRIGLDDVEVCPQ